MSDRSDFNDLAREAGTAAVAEIIAKAKPPKASKPVDEAATNGESLASIGENWPDPIVPGARPVPELDTGVIPGVIGQFADAVAEETQTPRVLSVLFVLSCMATAIHGRYEVAPLGLENGWREVSALWTCGCYPPGGKKSSIFSAAIAPILHWEKNAADRLRHEIYRIRSVREVTLKRIEKLKSDAARADSDDDRRALQEEISKQMEAMPDEIFPSKCFTGNASPERIETLLVEQNGKISVLSDEADQLLNLSGAARGGPVTLESVLKGHDGSPMRVDRQSRTAHFDRPMLSQGLIIQPATFGELAASSKRLRSTGLLARFIYGVPKSTIGKRNVRYSKPTPNEVKERYHYAMMDLLQGHENRGTEPKVIPFDDEAIDPFYEFMEYIEGEQGDGGSLEHITDWTAKLAGRVARIAMLFEIAERGLSAEKVSVTNVTRAIVLGHNLIPHAEAAFSLLGSDESDIDAVAVLRWIKSEGRPQFTRREAHRAMQRRFSKVERLTKALLELQDGYIISGEKRAKTGGRASSFYLVNPKIL